MTIFLEGYQMNKKKMSLSFVYFGMLLVVNHNYGLFMILYHSFSFGCFGAQMMLR
jgi:hypothetical protein